MTRNWRSTDHRRVPRMYPMKPTPRELAALRAVADGSSLTKAAPDLGLTASALGSILSCLYERLVIKDLGEHPLSQDRRRMAVNICKREGWWDTDA